MATTTKKSTSSKKTKTKAAKTAKKTTSKKVTKVAAKSSVKTVVKAPAKTEKHEVAKKPEAKKPKGPLTKIQRLIRWNVALAIFHAVQAGLVLYLSKPDLGVQTVTTNYLTTDSLASTPQSPVLISATHSLFDVNLAWLIAAFFIMSALAHISIATWYRKRYIADLEKGINKARWIEYSLSASTMMVAIALLAGVFDLGTLVLMFALTAVMNLCGLVMELVNQGRTKIDWSAYIVGTIAGIAPWIVYSFYTVGSKQYGEGGGPPSFVYAILISIFLFFSSFAFNMLFQYRKKGKWADYLYGEKVYMVLSLAAKTALAWQVYAGVFRP